MNKKELQKVRYQLDNALEALERLANEESIIKNFNVFSEIVLIKEEVEILIDSKTRKGV